MTKQNVESLTYEAAGVKATGNALGGLLRWVNSTLSLRSGAGKPAAPLGFFANVIELKGNLGLAISTDGVGTKIIIAEMMRKYDTVGIDCIAMNVNDVVCIGAEPISMVDYIAVERADEAQLEQIGKGLYEGARIANITIPGGELAQLGGIIRGYRDGSGFDLVGACVGLVELDKMLLGREIAPGDAVVGLRGTGLHSNGYTLARKALLDRAGYKLDQHIQELGRTLGEELLEPTRIYSPIAVEALKSGIEIHGMAHITSDGFNNLARLDADVGYMLDDLPRPQPIFDLIQSAGDVTAAEMFKVFNMGIGFCFVVVPDRAQAVIAIAVKHGCEARVIGHTQADPERRVHLPQYGLVGKDSDFFAS